MKTYMFSLPITVRENPMEVPFGQPLTPSRETHINIHVQAENMVEAAELLQTSLQQFVDERLQSTSMLWR